MNRIQKNNTKMRFLKLAELKCTGSPAELATILGISERSVKRLAKELRDEGIFIKYCPSRMSYVTEAEYS